MSEPSDTALRTRIETALRTAMKAREKVPISTLRTLLSALDNAGAVSQEGAPSSVTGLSADVPRRELTRADALVLLHAEADERRVALAMYEEHGRTEEAGRLRAEIQTIESFLED